MYICSYMTSYTAARGRGAGSNPANRFERLHYEPDPSHPGESAGDHRTRFYKDSASTVITRNDSPDIPFRYSLNPYRGCEHGCIYCYARPTHEYLGFSAGIEFETRIMVKEDAPALLRAELSAGSWKADPIVFSGVTDPYQPVERRLGLTRRCLEVLAEFRQPVALITKNAGPARDLDLLRALARWNACSVSVSLTTLDATLARTMEPRTASPRQRLHLIRTMAQAGIPVGVMTAPVIPGLNDTEIPAILEAAGAAGAQWAGYTLVRLPLAVAPLFTDWLERYYPTRKDRILDGIRKARAGKLNNADFGARMRGAGSGAEQVRQLFQLGLRRSGIPQEHPPLSNRHFRRPGPQQLDLDLE